MDNKQLLEFAAKAAGIFLTKEELAEKLPEWEWDEDFEPYHLRNGGMCGSIIWYGSNGEIGGTESLSWYPLDDDGDALRLAVTVLPFHVLRYSMEDYVYCNEDGLAATRRAIVRAAAEVGKEMK